MHEKLERLMGRFGIWISDNPIKTIVMMLLLVSIPIVHVPQIKFDTSNEGFLHDKDPILLSYNDFRAQFGRDERIAVSIRSDEIFTLAFLQKLKALHVELEEKVPYLDEVTSLYNVRNTRGVGDQLLTNDLLDPFPTTQNEVDQIEQRAMKSHFYRDLFISRDGKMTTIIIENDAFSHVGESKDESLEAGFEDEGFGDEADKQTSTQPRAFLSDEENSEVVDAVFEVVKKYKDEGLDIYVAGSPVVIGVLKHQMQTDMQTFTKVTFLIIIIFLFVMFRRVSAVVYPLAVVILSLLSTVGLMGWSDTAFKLPTQIVPSLLLAVSVGATVHVLSIFFDHFDETGDKEGSIKYTLGHSGLAIAMTGVTTAIGIGSFSGSEVAPISDMGLFASFGVMVSLILTLTLLPALLSITKLKPKKKKELGKMDHFMGALHVVPVRYYKQIIAISFIAVAVSIWTASKIELSHNPLFWFDKDKDVRIATEVIDEQMNGTLTIEGVVDSGKENGWQDPVLLNKLDKMARRMEGYEDKYTHIGKVISLATIVKETNQALHSNDEKFYTIPQDNNLVAQELLLFENSGSDDLEDVVDSQFSKIRVTAKVPWVDSIKAVDLLEYSKKELKDTFPEFKSEVTGIITILVYTFSEAIHSSVKSYIIAFSLIALMMMFILSSVRLGLLSMIPNLTPIILGLVLMYIFEMPLDMFTLLIGSIAIGLAVDDTIHFLHNFRRYYLKSGDSAEAIRQTFLTTGKAMVITTLVLSLGFYAYMMGQMVSVRNFGFLTGSVIVFALLADLFLAPALMMLVAKRGWIK
jgi:predicted RND superfamily exporter protein